MVGRFQMRVKDMIHNSICLILMESCCCAHFSSVWDPLTRWLPKDVAKQEFSNIQVTTLFGLNKFENIWAMMVIFFWKTVKILCKFQKCSKNGRKKLWFWRWLRLNLLREFLSTMTRIHVIGRQGVKKRSYDFWSD